MSGMTTAGYLAIAAAVASAAGTYISAQNSAAAANRQAKAEEYNAQANKQAAENAMLAASANEDAKRRENAMKVGSQKAALIESGMDISSGSGADLVEQSVFNTELDALNVRYQGQLSGTGYSNQSALASMNAANSRANAKSATGAGMYIGMASGALSAGSSAYTAGKAMTAK